MKIHLVGIGSSTRGRTDSFESRIVPHIGAAYNLARYLMGNEEEAKDVLQEAFLRAFRAFDRFENRNSLAWILMIVRNTSYNALKSNRHRSETVTFDEDLHGSEPQNEQRVFPLPEIAVDRDLQSSRVREAISRLPLEYREVIVLRELEDLSYKEIALILDIPEGTVMSRISRGRKSLKPLLAPDVSSEDTGSAM